MQTPKEKAKELVEGFLNLHGNIDDVGCAKTCSIEAVNLIKKAIYEDFGSTCRDSIINWYDNVISEIEELPC